MSARKTSNEGEPSRQRSKPAIIKGLLKLHDHGSPMWWIFDENLYMKPGFSLALECLTSIEPGTPAYFFSASLVRHESPRKDNFFRV